MASRTILIPLDDSQFSRQIVRIVRTFISPDGVDLVLFRAVQLRGDQPDLSVNEGVAAERRAQVSPKDSDRGSNPNGVAAVRDRHDERKQIEAEVAVEVGRLSSAGYSARAVVQYGEAAQCIITYANSNRVDMIAMATRGPRGLGRVVHDSVAEKVVHGVNVPVLLMRNSEVETGRAGDARGSSGQLSNAVRLRIATATDCSVLSKRAVTRTSYLVQTLHADLEVLVVAPDANSEELLQDLAEEAGQQVAEIEPAPQIVPLAGYADEAILQHLAAAPADILSIGAFKDRGESSTAAIGATAQRLVQYSPSSVLVCKGQGSQFQRVLACLSVDDSEIVDVIAQLVHALGAHLSLLHVIPPSAASYLATDPSENTFASSPIALGQFLSQGTTLSKLLRSWIDALGEHGLDQESMLLAKGSVPEAILATAQDGAYDLIVVGSDSSPGRYPNSIASNIVRYAEQSVLLLRNVA